MATGLDEKDGEKIAMAAGDKVIDAIRDESKDTRRDLHNLATEIRDMAKIVASAVTKSEANSERNSDLFMKTLAAATAPPPHHATMAPVANNGGQKWAIATFLTVIAALSTVVASEIANQRRELALVEKYQISSRDSADSAQKERILFLEGWADEHELTGADSQESNAAQWERIKSLERQVWGSHSDVSDEMEAPGADQ